MLHTFVLSFLLMLFGTFAPASSWAKAPAVFTFADVQALAQDLAAKPFVSPAPIPEFLLKLNYSEWSEIRYRKEKSLWADEGIPFTVQFFHPGLYYDKPVSMHIVTENDVLNQEFSASLFRYPNEALAKKAEAENNAFAGFRLHFPLNKAGVQDEVAIFLGASYFRALAKGNHYGIYSRGIALDTACPQGEEFPYFKEFWIVKPKRDDADITVFALMDSPSLAGAYRFVITPGAPTTTDVKCSLFVRQGAKNFQKVGLAPLTSMFFYGEEKNGRPNDYRPEIHNSDGLLFVNDDDKWFWSPLANPKRLQVNSYPLKSPRGFGLLQRDNAYASYHDLAARYDLRPSLWVEPDGDWGLGSLNLVEIPTEDELHDNIVAFWCPDKPQAAEGKEARYPDMLAYSWKLYWLPPKYMPHEYGQVISTRMSRNEDTLTFHVDFAGGQLATLPEDTGLASIVETPEPLPLLEKRLTRNPATQGWRLDFKVRLPKEDGVIQSLMAGRKGAVVFPFRAHLKKGENLPDPITETWVYDWQLQQ